MQTEFVVRRLRHAQVHFVLRQLLLHVADYFRSYIHAGVACKALKPGRGIGCANEIRISFLLSPWVDNEEQSLVLQFLPNSQDRCARFAHFFRSNLFYSVPKVPGLTRTGAS